MGHVLKVLPSWFSTSWHRIYNYRRSPPKLDLLFHSLPIIFQNDGQSLKLISRQWRGRFDLDSQSLHGRLRVRSDRVNTQIKAKLGGYFLPVRHTVSLRRGIHIKWGSNQLHKLFIYSDDIFLSIAFQIVIMICRWRNSLLHTKNIQWI